MVTKPKILQEPAQEAPTMETFAIGDKVLFHEYNSTENHLGTVEKAPAEGKLTVTFEDGYGTLKINRCYLTKAPK